jgi:hypothetical protein
MAFDSVAGKKEFEHLHRLRNAGPKACESNILRLARQQPRGLTHPLREAQQQLFRITRPQREWIVLQHPVVLAQTGDAPLNFTCKAGRAICAAMQRKQPVRHRYLHHNANLRFPWEYSAMVRYDTITGWFSRCKQDGVRTRGSSSDVGDAERKYHRERHRYRNAATTAARCRHEMQGHLIDAEHPARI